MREKNEWIIPLALTFLAIYFFASNRAVECISGDEPFTIYFSQLKVNDFVPFLFKLNNHPPTYELLLHWWMKWFGNDLATMRLVPAYFTALSTPAIYLIAKTDKGKLRGVLAAILFILSPFQMEWAHLIRNYSMVIFGATWSMFFFAQFVENKEKSALVGWFFFSIVATTGHYLSWLVICCQLLGFIGIANHSARQEWKRIAVTVVLLLAVNSVFLYYLIKRFRVTASEGTYVKAPEGFFLLFRKIFRMIGGTKFFPQNWSFYDMLWAVIPFVAFIIYISLKWIRTRQSSFRFKLADLWLIIPLILIFSVSYKIFRMLGGVEISPRDWTFLNSPWIGIPFVTLTIYFSIKWIRSQQGSFQMKLVLIWLIFPLILMFFASYKVPMFEDRYLSFISPAIPILIAAAIFSLPERLPIFAGAFLVIVFSINFNFSANRYSHPDQVMVAFKKLKTDQNAAIWSPGYNDLIFAYHYSQEMFSNARLHHADTLGAKIIREEGYTIYKEGIRRALQSDKIFIANNTDLLNLDISQENEIIFVDANSERLYPNNGLMVALKEEFGEPVKSIVFDYKVTMSLFRRQNN